MASWNGRDSEEDDEMENLLYLIKSIDIALDFVDLSALRTGTQLERKVARQLIGLCNRIKVVSITDPNSSTEGKHESCHSISVPVSEPTDYVQYSTGALQDQLKEIQAQQEKLKRSQAQQLQDFQTQKQELKDLQQQMKQSLQTNLIEEQQSCKKTIQAEQQPQVQTQQQQPQVQTQQRQPQVQTQQRQPQVQTQQRQPKKVQTLQPQLQKPQGRSTVDNVLTSVNMLAELDEDDYFDIEGEYFICCLCQTKTHWQNLSSHIKGKKHEERYDYHFSKYDKDFVHGVKQFFTYEQKKVDNLISKIEARSDPLEQEHLMWRVVTLLGKRGNIDALSNSHFSCVVCDARFTQPLSVAQHVMDTCSRRC